MESDFREARVTVVGLGLMGGSLAAALSSANACRQVVGVARRASTVATARALRFIHWGTTDLREGIQDADMVVLATPVGDILQRIAEIGLMLKPVASSSTGNTKGHLPGHGGLPAHVHFWGTSMCGKESRG